MAVRRMLGQHFDEVGVAARVFIFLRLARGAVGVTGAGHFHAFGLEHFAGHARGGARFLYYFRVGARAVAATGGGHRQAALCIMNADMQRGGSAHRMADDMRLVDLERIHQIDNVVALSLIHI